MNLLWSFLPGLVFGLVVASTTPRFSWQGFAILIAWGISVALAIHNAIRTERKACIDAFLDMVDRAEIHNNVSITGITRDTLEAIRHAPRKGA